MQHASFWSQHALAILSGILNVILFGFSFYSRRKFKNSLLNESRYMKDSISTLRQSTNDIWGKINEGYNQIAAQTSLQNGLADMASSMGRIECMQLILKQTDEYLDKKIKETEKAFII